jgi:hypothetical protein
LLEICLSSHAGKPLLLLLQVIETDERVAEIHANAEVFDRKAELSFKYLQVRQRQQTAVARNVFGCLLLYDVVYLCLTARQSCSSSIAGLINK